MFLSLVYAMALDEEKERKSNLLHTHSLTILTRHDAFMDVWRKDLHVSYAIARLLHREFGAHCTMDGNDFESWQ